jgi:hypothetical protein
MIGATEADYDFIANSKQGFPKLLEEIDRLKNMVKLIPLKS